MKRVGLSLLLWCGQVLADGIATAPPSGAQVNNHNNIQAVNIAPPNAAGISHNTFSQFNVPVQGAVLVNTGQSVLSQLAGMISGNPNITQQAAGLIINEVTHPNPSVLRGNLEVAGFAANVVIANPWGITCNGCGFINAPQVMLTTGVPEFDEQGNLKRYRVERGVVSIEGQGLKGGGNIDYLTILSRALTVNAKLQATHLHVLLGKNEMDVQTGRLYPLEANDKPEASYALDVGPLGGMYAQKIHLVGTEKGLGINYRGILHAPEGSVKITHAGDIEFSGNMKSLLLKIAIPDSLPYALKNKGKIESLYLDIAGYAVENEGQILTDYLKINTTRLKNAGQIQAVGSAEIDTTSIELTGAIKGAHEIRLHVKEGYENSHDLISAKRVSITEDPATTRARAAALKAEAEAAKRAAEAEAARLKEVARIEAERKVAAAEAARLEAERLKEAARVEAKRIKEEAAKAEAARLEAERLKEVARVEAARKAAEEEAARLEAERLKEVARIEAERKAAEEAARVEAARVEARRLEIENLEQQMRRIYKGIQELKTYYSDLDSIVPFEHQGLLALQEEAERAAQELVRVGVFTAEKYPIDPYRWRDKMSPYLPMILVPQATSHPENQHFSIGFQLHLYLLSGQSGY